MTFRRSRVLIASLVVAIVALLAGLGVWQVQRLAWKTDLIERVEARLAAPISDTPGPADWPALEQGADEYRRVTVTGTYLPDNDRLVKAVTKLGGGYWVMSPLRTDEDWTLWINRGFVPQDRSDPVEYALPDGPQTITGLLRVTQPGGGFLRTNDPVADRWYSRDIAALTASTGLKNAAPYFIDADRSGDALPVGGLTVVTFRNTHLVYAITWFTLAAGLAGASIFLLRRGSCPAGLTDP